MAPRQQTKANVMELTRKLDFVVGIKSSMRRNPVLANFAMKIALETGYSPGTVLNVLAGKALNETIINAMYNYMVSLTGDQLDPKQLKEIDTERLVYEAVEATAAVKEKMIELQQLAYSLRQELDSMDQKWEAIEGNIPNDFSGPVYEKMGGHFRVGRIKANKNYRTLLEVIARHPIETTIEADYDQETGKHKDQ